MINQYVKRITLARDVERRVGFAEVKIGDITIRRLSIWQSPDGKLRVFVPSHPLGRTFEDTVDIPADVLAQIEGEVIAAYHAEKEQAEKRMARRNKSIAASQSHLPV